VFGLILAVGIIVLEVPNTWLHYFIILIRNHFKCRPFCWGTGTTSAGRTFWFRRPSLEQLSESFSSCCPSWCCVWLRPNPDACELCVLISNLIFLIKLKCQKGHYVPHHVATWIPSGHCVAHVPWPALNQPLQSEPIRWNHQHLPYDPCFFNFFNKVPENDNRWRCLPPPILNLINCSLTRQRIWQRSDDPETRQHSAAVGHRRGGAHDHNAVFHHPLVLRPLPLRGGRHQTHTLLIFSLETPELVHLRFSQICKFVPNFFVEFERSSCDTLNEIPLKIQWNVRNKKWHHFDWKFIFIFLPPKNSKCADVPYQRQFWNAKSKAAQNQLHCPLNHWIRVTLYCLDKYITSLVSTLCSIGS
jgi:hypothetical protein